MANQSELGITGAYFDGESVILYGKCIDTEYGEYEIIDEWPADWPEIVDKSFLESHNVEVIDEDC